MSARVGERMHMAERHDTDLLFKALADPSRLKLRPDDGELTASFDRRSVVYAVGELDALVPAYAVTIHKSQGS